VRFARQQRREATPTEDALWQALRKRGLGVRFRRQHGIEGFVLDFYCEQAALAIEIDGAHHSERGEYDEWRTQGLSRHGIRVERVRVGDVETDLQGVVRRIAGWIAEQLGDAPPPGPLS